MDGERTIAAGVAMTEQDKRQPENAGNAAPAHEQPDPRRPKAPWPKTFRSRTGEVPDYTEEWWSGRYKYLNEKSASPDDSTPN